MNYIIIINVKINCEASNKNCTLTEHYFIKMFRNKNLITHNLIKDVNDSHHFVINSKIKSVTRKKISRIIKSNIQNVLRNCNYICSQNEFSSHQLEAITLFIRNTPLFMKAL
jgi:hypothetical protein